MSGYFLAIIDDNLATSFELSLFIASNLVLFGNLNSSTSIMVKVMKLINKKIFTKFIKHEAIKILINYDDHNDRFKYFRYI